MSKNYNHLPKICVVIRKRPLNKKQISRGEKDIIEIPNKNTVLVKEDKVKVDLTPFTDQYQFIFDAAFNQTNSNQQIYYPIVRPLIQSAYDGAKVSCFAYGQTGSGKTYTMLGDINQGVNGLYVLASYDVFSLKKSYPDISIWVSFYEIYCGKLYDLLNDRNILYAREDAKNNVHIVGLSQRKSDSVQEVMNTIQFGSAIRVTSQNSTNIDSSRSHAILQITLKKNNKIHGKISFIDLAGSQRAADHADQTDKQTRIDGAQINKSLLALKQCIRALDQNKNHTPFRGSKLTMVLKDSFVGYCKTVMIGNISPNSSSCQNTLNTLKYADRVKELKKPMKNDLIQGDYLSNLSKQLMLPRQLVSHQIQKNQPSQSENVVNVNNNKKLNNFMMMMDNMNNNNPLQKIRKNSEQIHNKINEDKQKNNMRKSHYIHQPQQQNSEPQQPHYIHKPTFPTKGNNNSSPYNQNKLIYQKNKSTFMNQNEHLNYNINISGHNPNSQQIYDHLAERHEQMMQKVIQVQENLIISHSNYINFSVECTKNHIHAMNEADQVGSKIQNYLDMLDGNLQKQIEEIYKLKAHIENLRYNLDEAKKIENLYLDINKNSRGYDQMEMEMEEEDLLFNG